MGLLKRIYDWLLSLFWYVLSRFAHILEMIDAPLPASPLLPRLHPHAPPARLKLMLIPSPIQGD